MKRVLILTVLFSGIAWGLNGGAQGGIISPSNLDLGFYAGGHLNFPDLFTRNLNLYMPGEIWMSGDHHSDHWHVEHDVSVTDISVAGQARYHFTGTVGFFAGGGLRIHFISESHKDVDEFDHTIHEGDDSFTRLGLDLCGGYSFGGSSVLITPEIGFQVGSHYDALTLGCAFTFGS